MPKYKLPLLKQIERDAGDAAIAAALALYPTRQAAADSLGVTTQCLRVRLPARRGKQ